MDQKKSFVLILILYSVNLYSQNLPAIDTTSTMTMSNDSLIDSTNAGPSEIVFSNPQISEYIHLMDSLDRENPQQDGYRIQLYSVSGPDARETIFEHQSKFLSQFPDLQSYAKWSSPNWVLRIGNYRSRLEAGKDLVSIHQDYPAAFILADQIESQYAGIKK